jgi:hypothetical protein
VTDPKDSALRRAVRLTALVLIVIGTVWALTLIITGGIDVRIGGRLITSHEPLRPIAGAAIGVILLIWADGVRRAHARWTALAGRLRPPVLAGALTAIVFILGVSYSSTTGTGSDTYGYVSQADLWIAWNLHVDQPWVAEVPWPNAKWSFSPLGYRPNDGDNDWRIVPTYSPGLPLLMAGAKIIGGQCAMFWVVPIFGAMFVLATYGIGCRLGSPKVGVIGAWFVATSPTMMFMLVLPMTDVPVGGAWAAAFYFLLGASPLSALAAGLLSGLAILIRPNLVFLAAIMGVWYLMRFVSDRRPGGRLRALTSAFLFSAGAAPFAVTIALVNQHLYGSPTTSGYGGIGGMFGWDHVWPNMQNYAVWLVESQTPFVLAGLAALAVPLRRLWPEVPDRRVFWLIGAFVLSIWAFYWGYLVFDIWWYLRFLLPSYPFIMLGLAAVAAAFMRNRSPAIVLTAAALVIGLGVYEIHKQADAFGFGMWRSERRYVAVAQNVARLTPENSVIWTMQHSGTIRYYGGRMTVRFDQIDAEWVDRAVAWFTERGVHSYFAGDDWELEAFMKRFAGRGVIAAAEAPPIMVHIGDSKAYLIDLSGTGILSAGQEKIEAPYGHLRCVPPAPAPRLVLR